MCELKNGYKDGYTGRLFEEEVFGKCLNKDGKKRASKKDSIEFAKKNQPWSDPSDPEPKVANKLHALVAIALELGDDWSELKFYTGVGSPLDYLGIDGFLQFAEGKIVTIDVTMNTEKSKEDKDDADLILSDETIENEVLLELFAEQTAEALQEV